MSDFNLAVAVVMKHEGYEVDDPEDPGGLTVYGFSTAFCKSAGISLPESPEEAIALYRRFFWRPEYAQIESQNVATKVFDDAVNQGEGVAVRMLQRALFSCGNDLNVDGVIGPATVAACNKTPEDLLLPYMRRMQATSYLIWISKAPMARSKNRKGLLTRAAWPDPDGTIAIALNQGTYSLPGAPSNVTASV
jgi:lysozyme family protein